MYNYNTYYVCIYIYIILNIYIYIYIIIYIYIYIIYIHIWNYLNIFIVVLSWTVFDPQRPAWQVFASDVPTTIATSVAVVQSKAQNSKRAVHDEIAQQLKKKE